MDQTAVTSPDGFEKKDRFNVGVKGLMVAVASCAILFWSGLSIRDHFQGYQPLRIARSGNAIERRTAVQDLADPDSGIDAEVAMPVLIAALGDEDARVRARAAESLSFVISDLRNRRRTSPTHADRLGSRIETATRGLVLMLSDHDPGVRAAAATGLGTMARKPSIARPASGELAAAPHESNGVQLHAARTIHGDAEPTLAPELVAALRDQSAEVRAAAARALAHFGPDLDAQIPTLMAMMERDDTNVRKACAEALEAARPSPALVPALIAFLGSRDRRTRAYAARLLGRIRPQARQAIPALIATLNERWEAEEWDRSGTVVSPSFPACSAARALGQMGPSPEAVAALAAVISPEKIERHLADSRRLGKVGSLTGPQLVLSAESARHWAAVQALSEIGPSAAAAIPALMSAYKTSLETGWILTQMAIPTALGRIAPNSPAAPEVVTLLIHGLDARDQSNRQGAVQALAHFGADAAAAIPKLRALQENRDTAIRDAARASLAAIDAQGKSIPGRAAGRPNP